MKNVYFIASQFMGHVFYACYSARGKQLFEVKGEKRMALRVAKSRGYSWQPLAGIIA